MRASILPLLVGILLPITALSLSAADSVALPSIEAAATAAFAKSTGHEQYHLVLPQRVEVPELPVGWCASFSIGSNHFHAGIATYSLVRIIGGWRWTRATVGYERGIGFDPPTEAEQRYTLTAVDDPQAAEFLSSAVVAAGVLLIPVLPRSDSYTISRSDLATIEAHRWGPPLTPADAVVSGSRAWNAVSADGFRTRLVTELLDAHLRDAQWTAIEPDAATRQACDAECLRLWAALRDRPEHWERECILSLGGHHGDRGLFPVFAEVLGGQGHPTPRWEEESDALYATRVEHQQRALRHQRSAAVRAIEGMAGKRFAGEEQEAALGGIEWLAGVGKSGEVESTERTRADSGEHRAPAVNLAPRNPRTRTRFLSFCQILFKATDRSWLRTRFDRGGCFGSACPRMLSP